MERGMNVRRVEAHVGGTRREGRWEVALVEERE